MSENVNKKNRVWIFGISVLFLIAAGTAETGIILFCSLQPDGFGTLPKAESADYLSGLCRQGIAGSGSDGKRCNHRADAL